MKTDNFSRLSVSVFVDAENVSGQCYKEVVDYAEGIGTISGFRVFGAESAIGAWRKQNCGLADIVCTNPNPKKKNGSDIALSVSAIDTLHLEQPDVFIIVSGDGDYLPLVETLKRYGRLVFCCSISTAISNDLRKACHGFKLFDPEVTINEAINEYIGGGGPFHEKIITSKDESTEVFTIEDLRNALLQISKDCGLANNQEVYIGKLGALLKNHGFSSKNFGEKKWWKVFEKYPAEFSVSSDMNHVLARGSMLEITKRFQQKDLK